MNTAPPSPPLDDVLHFADEIEETPADTQIAGWQILIVDDEPDVHEATLLALRDVIIENRGLDFRHAYTAAEAKRILCAEGQNFAAILLDVVMETSDAGLRLVREIREEMGLTALRIILRTGQPGYAPEIETIYAYDINDYKTKSELTRIRLYTSLTVAIRSFSQLRKLKASRQGLEKIVAASTDLNRLHGLKSFAEGVVTQLCALLSIPAEGIVCAQVTDEKHVQRQIIAAAGRYADLIDHPLDELPAPSVREALAECLTQKKSHIGAETCLYFPSASHGGVAICVTPSKVLDQIDEQLLKAFAANIAVGFDNVALQDQLQDLAYNDQLLRIPNRNRFVQLIDEHLVRPQAQVLALIDIDDFSGINAALDQHFGDQVLRAVLSRLQQALGTDIVCGRIAGDCFGLLGPQAKLTPDNITHLFSAPFDIEGETLRLSATTGFVNLGTTGSCGSELLKDASIALKKAKSLSRGQSQFFSTDLKTEAQERMRVLSNLRTAFSAEKLFLVYQPQVDIASQRVLGAEALLRWKTEDGQFIPPDQFIPLAEQSGLIIPIGEWVLRTACQQLSTLIKQGFTDFRMAINVSHAQFREPEYVTSLARIIEEYQVPPGQMEIELTESVAVEDIGLIAEKLAALHEIGVTIAIDDFGTGYSSLSILNQLTIDRIKIDRGFITGIDNPQSQNNIAKIIIALGKQLGLSTIAEGVETDSQLARLKALGCDEGQGYLFARPMDSERLGDWLASRIREAKTETPDE